MKKEEQTNLGLVEDKTAEDVLAELCLSTDKFGRFFFPTVFTKAENELTTQITNHIDSCLLRGKNKIGIAAPRGCGKTTKVLYGVIARRVAFKLSRLVVYVTNTATLAEMQLESLKYAMSASEEMKSLFGQLNPETNSEVANQFSRSAWIAYNRAMMFPRGAGQQIRGTNWRSNRPDLFIFDDLETREIAESDERRAGLRQWFYADAMEAISQYDRENAVYIYIDTLKHEDALLAHILEDPSWSCIRLSACDDDFNSKAPGFATKEQLIQKYNEYVRAGQEDSFFREMRNLPVSTKTALFKREDFRYFVEEQGILKVWAEEFTRQNNKLLRGETTKNKISLVEKFSNDSKKVKARDLITMVLVDPARTVSATAAESAILVVSFDLFSSAIYVRDVDSERITPDELYTKLENKILGFNARYLAVEETGLKEFISQPVEALLRKFNVPVMYIPISTTIKKEQRVKGLSPYYKRHLIYHADGQCTKLEQQLLSFPYSKLWDCMDCLSFIIPAMNYEGLAFQGDIEEYEENVEYEYAELDYERYDFNTEIFIA